MTSLVPNSYGVEVKEFNPCHTPAGSPAGGRFCSEGIPGRSAALVKAAQGEVDESEDRFSRQERVDGTKWGVLTDAEKATLDEVFTRGLAKESVRVGVPEDILWHILYDGRIKNQYESRQSRGFIAVDELDNADYHRRQVERSVVAVEPDFPGRDRPIYGYVAERSHGSVASYGSVTLVLDDSVKARTTVTLGDSFSLLHREYYDKDGQPLGKGRHVAYGMAMPLLKPGWQMASPYDRRVMASLYDIPPTAFKNLMITGDDLLRSGTGSPYIEAQIHGGVKVSDIREVQFRSNLYSGDDRRNRRELTAKLASYGFRRVQRTDDSDIDGFEEVWRR